MLLYVENKKNLVDKKIGIEIGLSDATISSHLDSLFLYAIHYQFNDPQTIVSVIVTILLVEKNSQRKRKLDIDFLT